MKNNYDGHNLVFIVGCPRSGTTWLQKLLASHPKVHTGQESDIFDIYIGPQLRAWRKELESAADSNRRAVGLSCYFEEEEFIANLREYTNNLLQPLLSSLDDDEVFVEKTPSHGLFIPEIIELLPACKFIHILRDARDVTASILAASKSWGKHWAPSSPKQAARMWVRHVDEIQKYAGNLNNNQFFELRYENLQDNTEFELKKLANFLELKWDQSDLHNSIQSDIVGIDTTPVNIIFKVRGEVSKIKGGDYNEPKQFIRKTRKSLFKEDLSLYAKLSVWLIARRLMKNNSYSWHFLS